MLILCYPKCTTCQKAQKWLDGKGIKYELRDINLFILDLGDLVRQDRHLTEKSHYLPEKAHQNAVIDGRTDGA